MKKTIVRARFLVGALHMKCLGGVAVEALINPLSPFMKLV